MRGVRIVGLTRFVNKGHLARAVLEAAAYQTRDIVEAINRDSGVALKQLQRRRRHGGQRTLLQIQADILNVPVVQPEDYRNHRLRRRLCRRVAVGFWTGMDELRRNWKKDRDLVVPMG